MFAHKSNNLEKRYKNLKTTFFTLDTNFKNMNTMNTMNTIHTQRKIIVTEKTRKSLAVP